MSSKKLTPKQDIKYTEPQRQKIIDSICEEVGEGAALRNAIKDHKISTRTFYRWLDKDEEKVKQYTRACADRADSIFEETLNIADTPMEGSVTKIDKDGHIEITTSDMIAHRRLQVDTRKWHVSKLNPKKYGDKLDVTSDGDKIDAPPITIINNDKKIDLGI